MPKVFHATLIGVELVGPKVRPIGVADGQQVKIPVLFYIWQVRRWKFIFTQAAIKGGQSGNIQSGIAGFKYAIFTILI